MTEGVDRGADQPSANAAVSKVSERYPTKDMPFVAAGMPNDDQFADALEDFLLNYGHNTARAYLGDLVDIYEWSQAKGLPFFDLNEFALKPYLALLRRRKYSENTIRRRLTAWRQFAASWSSAEMRTQGHYEGGHHFDGRV